jgi:hypothetical protein
MLGEKEYSNEKIKEFIKTKTDYSPNAQYLEKKKKILIILWNIFFWTLIISTVLFSIAMILSFTGNYNILFGDITMVLLMISVIGVFIIYYINEGRAPGMEPEDSQLDESE